MASEELFQMWCVAHGAYTGYHCPYCPTRIADGIHSGGFCPVCQLCNQPHCTADHKARCECPKTMQGTVHCDPISKEYWKKDDIQLQLLVIDLGDSCVVKVEEGRWSPSFILTDAQEAGESRVVTFTCGGLRSAIDDALADELKPVQVQPYFEMTDKQLHLRFWSHNGPVEDYVYHMACAFTGKDIPIKGSDAHPLPIYEAKKGEWKELFRSGRVDVGLSPGATWSVETADLTQMPELAIWRYTR